MNHLLEVEPGVFLSLSEGTVRVARADPGAVTISGHRYTDVFSDPRKWNPAGAGAQTSGRAVTKAPMPGKIVRVLVRSGDRVEAGQGLIVVEAMKMQNELKSSRPGQVSEVRAAENDTVEAGAVLIVVE